MTKTTDAQAMPDTLHSEKSPTNSAPSHIKVLTNY